MSIVADTLVIAGRNIRRSLRIPEVVFFGILQPVMFVVLFRYVFGGAIETGDTTYVNFLMAGIFVQTAGFAAFGTGISLAEDMGQGLIDRFRSLPMHHGAVVSGRVIADMLLNLVSIAVMWLVGFLVGFRPQGSIIELAGAIGVLLLVAFAFAWVGATIGLSMRSAQAVQTGGFVWLFPLTFVSSAFVPVETMPDWLQVFAEHQPFTTMVDAVRALVLDTSAGQEVIVAVAWCLAITAVFVPLSMRAFRRAAAR